MSDPKNPPHKFCTVDGRTVTRFGYLVRPGLTRREQEVEDARWGGTDDEPTTEGSRRVSAEPGSGAVWWHER